MTRPRDVEPVELPGFVPANLLLLKAAELQDAHFAAVERFRRQDQPMDTIVSVSEFGREKELQEVYLMLLQPDSKRPKDRLFKTADAARGELSIDEIAWLQAEHAERVRQNLAARGFKIEAPDGDGRTDTDQ